MAVVGSWAMEIWQAACVRGGCVCLVLCVASMLLVGALEVEVVVHVTPPTPPTLNAKSCGGSFDR